MASDSQDDGGDDDNDNGGGGAKPNTDATTREGLGFTNPISSFVQFEEPKPSATAREGTLNRRSRLRGSRIYKPYQFICSIRGT